MTKGELGPNKFTDEEQQQIDNITKAVRIDWEAWAKELIRLASVMEPSGRIMRFPCPKCGKKVMRLSVSVQCVDPIGCKWRMKVDSNARA